MSPLPGLIGATPSHPRIDLDALKAAIGSALVAAGDNQKTAAARMGIDPGQFSRQMDAGSLSIGKLLLLGPVFWAAFLPALATLSGAEQREPQSVLRAAALALADAAFVVGQLEERSA